MREPITVHDATTADLEGVLGCAPPRSARAVVFRRGPEVLGCAGLFLGPACYVLFGELTDEIRKSPRAIVRAYRQLMAIAKARGMPVCSMADPEVDGAERFLERMGFKRTVGREFQWPG